MALAVGKPLTLDALAQHYRDACSDLETVRAERPTLVTQLHELDTEISLRAELVRTVRKQVLDAALGPVPDNSNDSW